MLYFFHNEQRNVAVLVHGCTKQGAVAARDIALAVERKEKFAADPARHTYKHEDHNG
jgi:hypothetical protein